MEKSTIFGDAQGINHPTNLRVSTDHWNSKVNSDIGDIHLELSKKHKMFTCICVHSSAGGILFIYSYVSMYLFMYVSIYYLNRYLSIFYICEV